MSNLLQNAAKFTPRGGNVCVMLEADPGAAEAVLRVRDDGCGMDAQMLSHLFQPYSQSRITLDRNRGGLGLGLSLVKALVGMHGGSIAGSSAGPGKGAEFTIRLPLETRQAGSEVAAPPRDLQPQPRRVLIIEDNKDAADSLRDVLELDAHVVEVARSGREGLDKARHFVPEVVLCNLGLPGMDGFEIARRSAPIPGSARPTSWRSRASRRRTTSQRRRPRASIGTWRSRRPSRTSPRS